MQTKNNSDSVEPCTATNANNFSSRSYNVPNSNSSTKNSFSCQTLIVVVVEEKKRSDNISNSSSTSSEKNSFWQYIKL